MELSPSTSSALRRRSPSCFGIECIICPSSDLTISFPPCTTAGKFLVSVCFFPPKSALTGTPCCVCWQVLVHGGGDPEFLAPRADSRPDDASEAAVGLSRLMVRRPPPLRHAQAHLRTRHSQHPATRIHLVCGPSRSFLGAKKSAGRFHWVMGSFWRGGRGGVGGELKALFGGTGGPGAEQGGGASTSWGMGFRSRY